MFFFQQKVTHPMYRYSGVLQKKTECIYLYNKFSLVLEGTLELSRFQKNVSNDVHFIFCNTYQEI